MAADLVFNNHLEALKAVGSSNGIWNWVFIGADPKTYPVVGGGAYSITEMRECFEQADRETNPVLFGLLRLGFTAGGKRQTKHIFIIATDADSGAGAAKRGIAMGHREQMEKTFAKEGHASVCVVETHSADDISPENLMEKMTHAISVDQVDNDEGAGLNLESYLKCLEEEKERVRLALEEAARKKAQDEAEAAAAEAAAAEVAAAEAAAAEAAAAEAAAAAAAAEATAAELARRQAQGDEPCRVKVPDDALSLNPFDAKNQHEFLLHWKKCPNGHPLTKEKEGQKWHQMESVNCDVCAHPIERSSFRLRCNQSCDYDVCSPCFGMAYATTLSPHPVSVTSCIQTDRHNTTNMPVHWVGPDKSSSRTPGPASVPTGHTVILAWTGIIGHEAHPEHEEPGNVQMLPPDAWNLTAATAGSAPRPGHKLCIWSSPHPVVDVGARLEVVIPFDTCNERTNVLAAKGRQGVVQGKQGGEAVRDATGHVVSEKKEEHEAWLIHFDGESIFHWVWVEHFHKLREVGRPGFKSSLSGFLAD